MRGSESVGTRGKACQSLPGGQKSLLKGKAQAGAGGGREESVPHPTEKGISERVRCVCASAHMRGDGGWTVCGQKWKMRESGMFAALPTFEEQRDKCLEVRL